MVQKWAGGAGNGGVGFTFDRQACAVLYGGEQGKVGELHAMGLAVVATGGEVAVAGG